MLIKNGASAAESAQGDDGTIKEPTGGWHDPDVYSVSYTDIEILIDRQVDGEVEIRVWRNGKHEEYPYAKMTFEVDFFVCGHCSRSSVESAECEFCVNCCLHRSSEDGEDRETEVTLTQVYESLEAAIDVVCDADMRNAISHEYRKQIRIRRVADGNTKHPPDTAFDQQVSDTPLPNAGEALPFTETETAELSAFAKGIIEGMMEFRYGDSASSIDHWFQLGTIGDVHLCDDEEEQTIQAWACPLKFDDNGQVTGTDTSRGARLDLGANSHFGAKHRSNGYVHQDPNYNGF